MGHLLAKISQGISSLQKKRKIKYGNGNPKSQFGGRFEINRGI
jgi:hypothetical protein